MIAVAFIKYTISNTKTPIGSEKKPVTEAHEVDPSWLLPGMASHGKSDNFRYDMCKICRLMDHQL